MIITNFFDKTFCVNLDRRMDRWEECLFEFNKYNLTNIAYRISQNERFSDWWDSDNNCNTTSQKDYSMIDHVLVSANIDKQIINVYMYHGYKEYCGKMNSDHYPVVIDFKF